MRSRTGTCNDIMSWYFTLNYGEEDMYIMISWGALV